jgi:hypothetical protein
MVAKRTPTSESRRRRKTEGEDRPVDRGFAGDKPLPAGPTSDVTGGAEPLPEGLGDADSVVSGGTIGPRAPR